MTKHNKYYYDFTRNCTCGGACLCKRIENISIDNPDVPDYYKGKNGYMAKDVVANFDLSYNCGTATTYILRSKNKHKDGGVEDLKKAIAHLKFELEILEDEC
jgi:hypothetical protein